jgi:flagellar motor switch protein FliG
MDRLPEKVRPDVIRRMATIESVSPEVLREVGHALSTELKALVAGGMRKVDGKATALEILRRMNSAQQGVVLAEIEKDDGGLAAEVRGRLFTFADLGNLADRDLQVLLREIDAQRLTVALKGATADVRQKFLSNLSSRAAEMLSDDLQAMGPVKLSSVEAAQQEIAKQAQELASQGRITIVGPSEKML